MFQGMNRNETQALIGLILLIAVGIGVQTYQKQNQGGGLWLEHTASAETQPHAASGGAVSTGSEFGSSPETTTGLGSVVLAAININTANAADLLGLTMIGPVRAQSIIEYRQSNGPFQSVEDLSNVSGIGPKTMDRLRSSITVGDVEQLQTQTANTEQDSHAEDAAAKAVVVVVESADDSIESAGNSVAAVVNNEKININTASVTLLETLSGIGPVKAGNIVQWRASHGFFQSLEGLTQVSGIGPKTLQSIRPFITLGRGSSAQSKSINSNAAQQRPVSRAAIPSKSQKININTASVEQLQELSGVGPVKAKKIVQWRNSHGYFRRAEDLTKVSGIGPKTLEKNIHRISTRMPRKK